tara:strand:+ start:1228 stop:1710 length:483 start_codon:yes stop_codon:yes gene_type:complete
LITFDQSKIRDDTGKISLTTEAEAVRLSNELRSKPSRTYIGANGKRIDIPAKQGFDIETADFKTIVNWLADSRIKKSESLIAFVHRFLSIKFSNEYSKYKSKIDNRYKLEHEMIESNSKNDIFWLGEVGFSNMVRLDGSLNNKNTRVIKQKNGEIKTVKI